VKITGTFSITGRGHGVTTNEPFTAAALQTAKGKTMMRVVDSARVVELKIISVEALLALVPSRAEFLAFVVPAIADSATESLLQGKEVELR
jgi:hypothetical protein